MALLISVGDNVTLATGVKLLAHDIPSNSVYAGNPAKFVCTFEEYLAKHSNNQSSHPIFREHTWQEWPNVTKKEKEAMQEKLKNTFGYL